MPDYTLYLVTDTAMIGSRDLIEVVAQAIEGGVSMVQLREKTASTRDFYEVALRLRQLTQAKGIPLIINDRLDIALAVEADGLHIGQQDLPFAVARHLLGDDKIIGLSVETVEQAEAAQHLSVDYLGVSPVFNTTTKADIASPLGLAGLQAIASFTKHPLVGIGGIDQENAAQVIQVGAQGIAVVSAIMASLQPKEAAQQLRTICEAQLKIKNL
ncbi:MAG: thiamine phosphate synthase [Thermonemataceae bacterium]